MEGTLHAGDVLALFSSHSVLEERLGRELGSAWDSTIYSWQNH